MFLQVWHNSLEEVYKKGRVFDRMTCGTCESRIEACTSVAGGRTIGECNAPHGIGGTAEEGGFETIRQARSHVSRVALSRGNCPSA
jgi:hypothetical protein